MTVRGVVKRGAIRRFLPNLFLAPWLIFLAFSAPDMAWARPLEASIVIDADSGTVISASNADAVTYPASLTKMMTLYMVFEALRAGRLNLDEQIYFSTYSAGRPATNLAADPGDRIRVETAILALVVRSANDVAAAIGEKLAGSESGFARKMTEKAHALGMNNTNFRNASGLPDPKQKTTARDMAILGRALITDFPEYYEYFSRTSFSYGGVTYTGHNRVLKKFKGADGIKTGYIRASGFNLVSSAERDGTRLVAVVLGGTSPSTRDRWMMRLLEKGFAAAPGGGGVEIAEGDQLLTKPAAVLETDPVGELVAAANLEAIQPRLRPGTEPVPGVADDQEIVNVWTGHGDFGIQVGAFAKHAAAEKAANGAADAFPELLGEAKVVVDSQKTSNGSKLYRAKVIGLTRETAERACRDLAQRRTDCLVVKIDNNLAMGG